MKRYIVQIAHNHDIAEPFIAESYNEASELMSAALEELDKLNLDDFFVAELAIRIIDYPENEKELKVYHSTTAIGQLQVLVRRIMELQTNKESKTVLVNAA